MLYELPDPTTPFRSQAELTEHLRSPRYANDTAFREACEAKLKLDGEFEGAPRGRVIEAARSTVNPLVGEAHLTTEPGSMEKAGEIVTLTREIAELEEVAKVQAEASRAVLRIPKAPPADTSKAAEPFESADEMVRHMSDPRYSLDDAFRANVEARVHASDNLPGISSKDAGTTSSESAQSE